MRRYFDSHFRTSHIISTSSISVLFRRIHWHGSSSRRSSTRHALNRRSHTASKQPQMILILLVNSLCLPPAFLSQTANPQNATIFALHHASFFIDFPFNLRPHRSRHLRSVTTQLSTIDGPTTRTGVRSNILHRHQSSVSYSVHV